MYLAKKGIFSDKIGILTAKIGMYSAKKASLALN